MEKKLTVADLKVGMVFESRRTRTRAPGVYRLRPESKRVFIAGMKFMCEKPSDRQLVQFDKEENFIIINPNNGRVMWRDITPAHLSRLFDDEFYFFNPTDEAERQGSAADTIELHFANGTTVTVSVK